MRISLSGSTRNVRGRILRCALVAFLAVIFGDVATAQGHSVTLAWTASVSTGVTGYNVYRTGGTCAAATVASMTKLTSAAITTLTYTDTTASTAGNMYCFAVTAVSANGESGVLSGGSIQVVIPLNVAAPPAAPVAPALTTVSAT